MIDKQRIQGIVASSETTDLSLLGYFFDNQTLANDTSNGDQLICLYKHVNDFLVIYSLLLTPLNVTHILFIHSQALTNFTGCPPTHDSALCWPPTPPKTLAILRCDFSINGYPYDSEGKCKRIINYSYELQIR